MNNIYKVIWSKAKNCYVVASEIARAHTKSASGSEKIGGGTRRKLLASLMALSLLCGGLGVTSASLEVVDQSGTDGTVTIYTKDEVDKALDTKGAATDVETNKAAIADLKNAVGNAGNGLTKEVADQKAAIAANAKSIDTNKAAIESLQDDKLGKDLANSTFAAKTELDAKANTDLSNLTADGENKIKNIMSAGMDLKADKTTVDALDGRVGNVEGKVTALETKVGDASSGLVKDVATLKTTVGDASSGLVKDVNDLNTAIGTKANQNDLVAATNRITANEGNITELQRKTKNIDYDAANETTSINGMKVGQQVDMGGKDITNARALTATGKVTGDGVDAGTGAITGGSLTVTGKVTGNGVDAGAGDITTTGNVKGGTLETTGNASIGGALTATGKVTGDGVDAGTGAITGGSLTVTGKVTGNGVDAGAGDITTTGNVKGGTLETTGNATIGGALTATGKVTGDGVDAGTGDITGGSLTVTGKVTGNGVDAGAGDITTTGNVKGGTLETTGDAKIGGDLTVDGKLNVGEISMKNDKLDINGNQHDSTTTITADGISNNAKVTDRNGVTTESKFTHDKKGSTTYAKKGDATNWKESTSNVTADGVSNKMTDSDKNTHTYSQTATESKEQLVNGDKSKSNFEKKTAEGNTISITEKDAAGNPKSSLTNTQTVAGEKTSVTNKDSSSTIKQGADQIRNYVASTDGTKSSTEVKADGITNTSDGTITNDANHIENKANTMDTNVTGKATESYGELETTVNGNETHKVTGNQENTIGGNQTTTVKGKVTENYNGGQETSVTGDQVIKVSGTQTTTATDINRNASSGMIDTIDNDYGTNTETKVAGKTTTDVSIKGTGEEGKYIRGANESRDYLIKGTLKNSETKTVEATSTEITDGNGKTSATIQDKTQISGSVTNGTSSAVSNVKADSIDTAVIEGTNTSLISQKKDSITSAVGNGTTSTVIQQGDKDITIASNGGTVGIVGKDIINNATNEITNTAGTKITDKVGNNTRVIDQTSITDTVGTASRKIEDGKITDTAGDSTVTTENGKGTTFAKAGSAAYSTEAGAPTDTNIAGNHITTGRVDANELGVSDKDDQGNTADFSVKAGEGIKGSATDKDGNKTYTKVTATENSFQVQDKDGMIKNHQVNTKDKSENTITNGDKTNTVTSTADGTIFSNSKAAAPITGASGEGNARNTKIKGNTITTGKVTMDYADVMKDLGVHGNATVDKDMTVKGNTTLGEAGKDTKLTVNSKATFNEKATFENGAEVKNGLTVSSGGLNVTGESTFNDKVTMNNGLDVTGGVASDSFTVKGTDIKIDSSGINAGGTVISNVADGSISEGSKDAVNGGQLYQVKNDLEGKVNKVGANAAAMANLHPMEFDPDSKWNIAAAMGNYGSETATAIGAFYRPNEDVMVNFSTAFGTGENMVGGGVSVRLGKGGNKLSREESNALKDQVNDLTARMDALLSVLNPNMSKDFPDVPENHWAYEAVSRLAGNDIVQGYPDGEFHGERTMTRYEMAEIIYNALSRGAEAEKELVEEFKPELQAMAASEKATAERAEG